MQPKCFVYVCVSRSVSLSSRVGAFALLRFDCIYRNQRGRLYRSTLLGRVGSRSSSSIQRALAPESCVCRYCQSKSRLTLVFFPLSFYVLFLFFLSLSLSFWVVVVDSPYPSKRAFARVVPVQLVKISTIALSLLLSLSCLFFCSDELIRDVLLDRPKGDGKRRRWTITSSTTFFPSCCLQSQKNKSSRFIPPPCRVVLLGVMAAAIILFHLPEIRPKEREGEREIRENHRPS